MAVSSTPHFKNPPVIERVLGVQFAPIKEWGVHHFGLFYQKIRNDFPECQAQPPIASITETPDHITRVEMADVGDVRCWFLPAVGGELIQLQRDRFLMNWRRRTAAEDYPRFSEKLLPL